MNKLFSLLAGGLLLATFSCNNKHEVIPPPLKVAELDCSCKATVDGILYEYTDTCRYDNQKTINSTSLSEGRYSTKIENASMNQGFEIEMRNLEWFDDGSNLPTVEEWKLFFNTNLSPLYYVDDNLSSNGVTVKWTDPTGVVWSSDTTSVCSPIDFLYTSMEHDSDATGNYMKYKAVFNCALKNASGDVICVENGVVKTSFRRE